MLSDSLLLTRLSQARKLLENSQNTESEAFNLRQFRIRARSNRNDEVEIAQVRASDKEDENSFGIKFMMGLLKSPNQVLAYAAVKTLVALSDYLRKKKRDLWPSFLLALWKDAQCWASCPDPSLLKEVQVYGKLFLRNGKSEPNTPAHEDACLLATSNTLQALHQSLKRCLKSSDENIEDEPLPRLNAENLEVFLCMLTTRMSKLTNAICIAEEQKEAGEQLSKPCSKPTMSRLTRELSLGALLRLLCTGSGMLTLISDPENQNDVTRGAYLNMSLALIPVISSSALPPHKNCSGRSCISTYLRHKLLMFMLKLSKWFDIKPSLGSSCYTFLRFHGSDLLEFSLQDYDERNNFLNESPFAESLLVSLKTEPSAVPSVRRLQRRALLILLRIAHATYRKAHTDRVSDNAQPGVVLPAKRSWEELTLQCSCDLPSRVYLRDWMDRQYQLGVSGFPKEFAQPTEICASVKQLSNSFIQLYVEEDDLLLMTMLQLADMQFLSSVFMCPKHPKEDMFCRIAVEAFRPSRLIHAFLAAINFDYATIEKLLISKTSGVLCLTYLLRSLRHISDSWPDFVHASPWSNADKHCANRGHGLKECTVNSHTMRCKLCSYQQMCSHGVVPYDDVVIHNYMNLKRNAAEQHGRCWCDCNGDDTADNAGNERVHLPNYFLGKAADFLQGLKNRVEDLHSHALFPYNPTPLLSRLKVVVDLLRPYSTTQ
ncbi:protein Lines [Marchantia polymorpha subsp. ruderalis]|uniref:Protein Lines C-terminal domain-containing protein n=1 Tax=Marchantia polymorpha TaxID=3197 RepID=A0A2R6W9S1_MARPO|nr:hypothetical protein MARPO_0122s0032 [Marchantia polymorpha]BBN02566.1 hypothetical protein Mp_2g16320 [Marchantia polymorpha subsp. ruderalis]|eukprot:PTQ30603.1 hypothetical protein MARPO_0122s0032 [Marchantia polymorpha]